MKSLACLYLLMPGMALSQDLSKNVDYSTVAVPLDRALAQISDLAKVSLRADSTLANEPVILRLRHVPASDAMKRIADVVHAEWRPVDGGGFELYRSSRLVERLTADRIDRQAKFISSAVRQKLKDINGTGPWTRERAMALATDIYKVQSLPAAQGDEKYQLMQGLNPRTPDNAALWRVVAAFDPKQLASVGPGERVVFSDLPNKTQVQATGDGLNAPKGWVEQDAELASDLAKIAPAGPPEGASTDDRSFYAPFDSTPTRFILAVTRLGEQSSMWFSLIAFGPHNNPLRAVSDSLNPFSQEELDPLSKEWKSLKEHDAKPIALRPASTQLLQVRDGTTTIPVKDPLRSLLVAPDENDPLSLLVSDALLDTATIEDRNLAACPDDLLFQTTMSVGQMEKGGGMTFSEDFLSTIGPLSQTSFAEDDTWITASSLDPLSATENRMNRKALEAYVKAIDQKGYVSIDDNAEVADSVAGRVAPTLLQSVPFLIFKDIRTPDEFTLDLSRFYSSLGPDLVNRALSGPPLRVGDLNAAQLERFNACIFDHQGHEQPVYYPVDPNGKDLTEPKPSAADFWVMREATETLPNGATSDGTIGIKETNDDSYLAHIDIDGAIYIHPLSLGQVAQMLALASLAPPNSTPRVVKSIEAIRHRVLHFDFWFAHGGWQGDLEETAPTGKEYPIGQLPPDLQSKLDGMVQQMITMMKSGASGHAVQKPPEGL